MQKKGDDVHVVVLLQDDGKYAIWDRQKCFLSL